MFVVLFCVPVAGSDRAFAGQIVHYIFRQPDCIAFNDEISPDNPKRTLTRSRSAICNNETFGVTLDSACYANEATYQPSCNFHSMISSSGGAFFEDASSGFSIELWISPANNQRTQYSSGSPLALFTFSDVNPGDGLCSETISDAGTPVSSLRLLQTKTGCLQLEVQSADERCKVIYPWLGERNESPRACVSASARF